MGDQDIMQAETRKREHMMPLLLSCDDLGRGDLSRTDRDLRKSWLGRLFGVGCTGCKMSGSLIGAVPAGSWKQLSSWSFLRWMVGSHLWSKSHFQIDDIQFELSVKGILYRKQNPAKRSCPPSCQSCSGVGGSRQSSSMMAEPSHPCSQVRLPRMLVVPVVLEVTVNVAVFSVQLESGG